MINADNYQVDVNLWPDVQKAKPEDRQPPGGFSLGNTYLGGPLTTDAFGAKRAPSPWRLVENFKTLIYAMVARNRNAVTRIPLRLYADGSRAQGGKPRSACDPIRVSRHNGQRLSRAGLVSSAAVDQVFEVRNHPILSVLDRPDPYGYFNREKLIGLMVSYCDVVGSCYLYPEGPGWSGQPGKKGPPDTLWTLYSQYVLPIRKYGSPLIDRFQYFATGIAFDQVLWFRQNHSLRDPYGTGYSPTYAGENYRAQEDKFITMFDQVLGLGPRPQMIASAKDQTMPPGEDMARRLEQDLMRKQSGGYAGGVLVNRGAWDFTPVTWTPADLAGKELSEYDRNCLASIFDQPPTYYTVDTNLANLQAADEQHARQGVEPRCKSIAGTLTWLVQTWDPRLFFAFDSALMEDELSKAQVVQMRLQTGQTTINQENEEGRWPPVPWGDEPWMASSLKQPSMIIEGHEQGMEQLKAGLGSQPNGDDPKSKDDEPKSKPKDNAFKLKDESEEDGVERALQRLERELVRRAG